MRTDTLKLFGWELFGRPILVSQLLSVIFIIAGFTVLIINKRKHPHGQEALFVNRLAARKEAEAAAVEEAAVPAAPGEDEGER